MLKKILGLGLLFLTTVSCSHWLYYPSHHYFIHPKTLTHPPQEIRLNEPEGSHLVAWYFRSPTPSDQIILLFHGNAQNISSHFTTYYWALSQGYDFLIFDYPGFGGSSGTPTPQNTVESGLQALKFVQKKWPQKRIIIAGQSLGGTVAIKTLSLAPSLENVCAIVIESSFLSYKKVGQKIFARQWFTWPYQWIPHLVLSDTWSAETSFDSWPRLPLLIFHREKDPIVSVELGRDLFARWPEPKSAHFLPGEGHVDTYESSDGELNRQTFKSFTHQHCPSLSTATVRAQ